MKLNFILIFALSFIYLMGCAQEPVARDVEAKEFQSLLTGEEGIVLDVRTPDEFAAGHLPKALNLNIHDVNFPTELKKLDHAKPVYVYCQAGGRSSRAMKMLHEEGFVQVYNLLGGYGAWPYK